MEATGDIQQFLQDRKINIAELSKKAKGQDAESRQRQREMAIKKRVSSLHQTDLSYRHFSHRITSNDLLHHLDCKGIGDINSQERGPLLLVHSRKLLVHGVDPRRMLHEVHQQARCHLPHHAGGYLLPQLFEQVQQLVPLVQSAERGCCIQDLLGPDPGAWEWAQEKLKNLWFSLPKSMSVETYAHRWNQDTTLHIQATPLSI